MSKRKPPSITLACASETSVDRAKPGMPAWIGQLGHLGSLGATDIHFQRCKLGVAKFVNTCSRKMSPPELGGSASDQPGVAGRDVM